MTLPFQQYLDLLETQGRTAAHSLGQLSPADAVPPRGESARGVAGEQWATLEIWARSLENPAVRWDHRARSAIPKDYLGLVAGISDELDRLARVLADAGPDVSIDYFDRRGTTAEVARLLAHEVICAAHCVSLAAAAPARMMLPEVASDGIAHILAHWGTAVADGEWDPSPVAVRATDAHVTWHLLLGREGSDSEGEFCVVPDGVAVATVEASATSALWWLHGHVQSTQDVAVSGDGRTIRRLRSALMHPEDEAPKRRRRWFGW
ncbi:MAG: hypothetical protein ACTHWA_04335 [Arachnia sp.]